MHYYICVLCKTYTSSDLTYNLRSGELSKTQDDCLNHHLHHKSKPKRNKKLPPKKVCTCFGSFVGLKSCALCFVSGVTQREDERLWRLFGHGFQNLLSESTGNCRCTNQSRRLRSYYDLKCRNTSISESGISLPRFAFQSTRHPYVFKVLHFLNGSLGSGERRLFGGDSSRGATLDDETTGVDQPETTLGLFFAET